MGLHALHETPDGDRDEAPGPGPQVLHPEAQRGAAGHKERH